jgi:hypothetical protein
MFSYLLYVLTLYPISKTPLLKERGGTAWEPSEQEPLPLHCSVSHYHLLTSAYLFLFYLLVYKFLFLLVLV